MKLRHIVTNSGTTGCPAVFETDRNTYVVQGYVVTDTEALERLGLPQGETAVEVPKVLLEYMKGVV